MIEVHIKEIDGLPEKHIHFHGRDHRDFHIYPNYRTMFPEHITISISNNVREYGWIQFRGPDCNRLINGILDSASTFVLKQIQLGIQERLDEREKRP